MAILIKWQKFNNIYIGDPTQEDNLKSFFTGVRAIGEIDGRRFIQLIFMDKGLMDDIDLEKYVHSVIENTKEEDITIEAIVRFRHKIYTSANYVCD